MSPRQSRGRGGVYEGAVYRRWHNAGIGESVPALATALQDDGASTAYAAGQVLAALARGAARQMDIVQALAAAIRPTVGRPMCRQVGEYLGQLDERLAEKIRALLVRGKPRDLYDIWLLLRQGVLPDAALIARKLALYGITWSREALEDALAPPRRLGA